jgi:dTDP-4-amino-4,6-dideoxygalactose transaminase
MTTTSRQSKLAIHGGKPLRPGRMPPRIAFGDDEAAQLKAAIDYYRTRDIDPPYKGHFEQALCESFVAFMGGGYANAVSTGTAACYVALAALQLPANSEVIISPVTDSGPLNSIILQGYTPVLADSAQGSYNMGVEQFLERVTPNTTALMAVHCGGEPLEIDRLVEEAHKRGIKVIEDCSQAPGAVWKGRKVGTFGDVAAFSTMYRKTFTTGASGGIVYAQDQQTFRLAQAHSDRGKPVWRTDVNLNDPGLAAFPAHNFNTDEFSCAIGISSLKRLQRAIDSRNVFVSELVAQLPEQSRVCRPYAFHQGFSPFFFPIFVDTSKTRCTKMEFARAVAAEGVDLNPHYGCVVSSWPWAEQHLSDGFVAVNALKTRDESFNLSVNERYGSAEVRDVIEAILKVESYYSVDS